MPEISIPASKLTITLVAADPQRDIGDVLGLRKRSAPEQQFIDSLPKGPQTSPGDEARKIADLQRDNEVLTGQLAVSLVDKLQAVQSDPAFSAGGNKLLVELPDMGHPDDPPTQ